MSFKKVLFGVTGGSMLGWLAHVGVSKFDDKSDDKFPDIMSSQYKTTPWDSNWDKRAPSSLINPKKLSKNGDNSNNNNSEELKKMTPTATRHLLLIRHGQYNLDGNTDADRILTPLGREQAMGTAKRLIDLAHPYTVLVHSSMARARETSEIIHTQLPDLPTVQCDLLREGSPFLPEPEPAHWRAETKYHTDSARIEAAFRKYFHRADPKQTADSYEIIVCHANVIRYFACRALQLPPEAWLRLSLFNASITMFTIRPSGNVSLRTLGDAGHLPAKMCTTT